MILLGSLRVGALLGVIREQAEQHECISRCCYKVNYELLGFIRMF